MRSLNLFLLFFFLFALNSYSLPKCEGDDYKKWNNCEGTLTWADGDKYLGGHKDGKEHGEGTYTYANGDKYMGEWKKDKFHIPDNKKERHGKGIYIYSNGDKYEGMWKKGLRHGKGIMTYSKGKIEEGYWKKDKFVKKK